MNFNRRSFLKKNALIGGGLLFAGSIDAAGKATRAIHTRASSKSSVHISCTNDLRGQMDTALNELGGMEALKQTLNNQEISRLVFDAGGFSNPKGGEKAQAKTIAAMNQMGYRAVNVTAHDLSRGLAVFKSSIPDMNFPLVSCNYTFENPQIQNQVKLFEMVQYGSFKVGITGIGESASIAGLQVSDPGKALKKVAAYLRNDLNCDLVICLSHLREQDQKSEIHRNLAEGSTNVDLFITGNHSESKSGLAVLRNAEDQEVFLNVNHHKALSVAHIAYHFNADKQRTGVELLQQIPGAANTLNALNTFKTDQFNLIESC